MFKSKIAFCAILFSLIISPLLTLALSQASCTLNGDYEVATGFCTSYTCCSNGSSSAWYPDTSCGSKSSGPGTSLSQQCDEKTPLAGNQGNSLRQTIKANAANGGYSQSFVDCRYGQWCTHANPGS